MFIFLSNKRTYIQFKSIDCKIKMLFKTNSTFSVKKKYSNK